MWLHDHLHHVGVGAMASRPELHLYTICSSVHEILKPNIGCTHELCLVTIAVLAGTGRMTACMAVLVLPCRLARLPMLAMPLKSIVSVPHSCNAGTGYMTACMALLVGYAGIVVAVERQERLLRHAG